MEIRLVIPPGGVVSVESISILEDLWHDYRFFKSRALALEAAPHPDDQLVVKRYYRAALLMLVFYLEGVVNRWLQPLVEKSEWETIEKYRLKDKIKKLEKKAAKRPTVRPRIAHAKRVRDALAHLKPGSDLAIYDKVTDRFLSETEASITGWLTEMEGILGIARHPNTQEESRPLREALGTPIPETEGYSGNS